MMKPSIAVFGEGFVGGSLTTVFTERGFDVYAYDKANKYAEGAVPCVRKERDVDGTTYEFPISVTELVTCVENVSCFSGIYFVCLPTPMNQDGSCDLSIVESVLEELANSSNKEKVAVVKSTVPPGSTRAWNERFNGRGLFVVHSPEFLTEKNALQDMRDQDRIIIGGPRPQVDRVRDVFRMAFPDVPIHKTSSSNSELVKYITNCFLATKVSFANEIYQVCDKLHEAGEDVDYDRCIELATLDKRLGTSHWKVPSFEFDESTGKHFFGFSLSCFPKDLNSLIFIAQRLGVDPKVLNGTWTKNVEVRPSKDWEQLIGRAISEKS